MSTASTFPCPTVEEIQAAGDAITKDGPGAEATAMLSFLMMLSPVLKDATQKKVQLLRGFVTAPDYSRMPGGNLVQELMNEVKSKGLDATRVLLEGSIQSLTIYGLNLGIRIGEARREGLRSRASIENMLTHVRTNCDTSEESREAAVRILRWVLGENVSGEKTAG